MTALVRAACLTNYAEVALRCGLDARAMLREAGLPFACLGDADLRISVDAVRRLLEHSAAQSGEEAFALQMVDGRRLSNLGVVGMLMREEPTVRAALQSVASYGRAHNEALVHSIEESGGIATVREELLMGTNGPARQGTELVVGVTLRVARFFLGARWQPRRVCFTHAAPESAATHVRVFGQMPEFEGSFNGFVCTSADLDTPIASSDPVVGAYVRQQAREQLAAAGSVAQDVRHMIVVLLPRGRCTAEQVAALMGVTRRTLHRRLRTEGHIFRELVQDVRRELATRYVAEPNRRLGDLAPLLGFAELSSFSRWHRRQFGTRARQPAD